MTRKKPRTVTCPTCDKPVAWTECNRYRPFCSERCKLIDFGDWVQERHTIPGESTCSEQENSDDAFQ